MSDQRIVQPRNAAYFALRQDIESFYFDEADLIDERRFEDWLECFSDDLVYFMPMRENVPFGEHAARENTRAGRGISWFEEDKWTLGKRVEQIMTGFHYAEEPLSRVSHLITNVRITAAEPDLTAPSTVDASCRFLIYQNRVSAETYLFVGKRHDRLRRTDDGRWQVFRREIVLDQNVLQAKNLSTFF